MAGPGSLCLAGRGQGDVVDVEAHGLADAGAGGIQELQQRPVAQPGGRVRSCGLQDPGDLVDADGLGQAFAGHGRVDVAGRVGGGDAFECPELVESAHGHHRPGRRPDAQGRAAVGPVGQRLDEAGDVVPGDLGGALAAGVGEVPGVAGQVPPVRGEGVGRESPLHAHVLQVVRHGAVYRCQRPGGRLPRIAAAAGGGRPGAARVRQSAVPPSALAGMRGPRRVARAEALEVVVPGGGGGEDSDDGGRVVQASLQHGQDGLIQRDPVQLDFGFLVGADVEFVAGHIAQVRGRGRCGWPRWRTRGN